LILLKDGTVLSVFEIESQVVNTIEETKKETSKDIVYNCLASLAEYNDLSIHSLHIDLELAKKINSAIFPGIQGGPLEHVIAAKAVAFKEVLDPAFKVYAQQILDNAQAMAQVFRQHERIFPERLQLTLGLLILSIVYLL